MQQTPRKEQHMDSEAKKRYDKENTKQILLKFNIKNDEDILQWLEQQPSKQGYIKELIRSDIAKS